MIASAIACLAGLVLVTLAVVTVIVLVKLGVIANYAFREEPPDEGVYDLDQSREVGEE